jgi:hypothetical protein
MRQGVLRGGSNLRKQRVQASVSFRPETLQRRLCGHSKRRGELRKLWQYLSQRLIMREWYLPLREWHRLWSGVPA